MDCLFCKIVNKTIPSYTLYEDDDLLVFLDRFPQCTGHTIIIPKYHAVDLFDFPVGVASRVLPLAQTIGAQLREVLGFDGLNILQNNGTAAGQEIMHYHMHLIPRFENDSMTINAHNPRTDPAPPELEAFVQRFKKIL